jgi:uncharacterized membrane protein YhaH (DUF805 family)
MNRPSYALLLALLVAAYIVMIGVIKIQRPPGAEVFILLITVPRLHDVGRSGWWLLALLAAEIIAVMIGWPHGTDGILMAGGIVVLCSLFLLVILALVPGQPHANKWGDPPRPGISWKRPKSADEERQEIS